MAGGYIKLWRKTTEWGWWKDVTVSHFFEYCLMKAAYLPGHYLGKPVGVGEFYGSISGMAFETGLTKYQVRRAIECLTKTGEIASETASGLHHIKVAKYAEYQDIVETQTAQQTEQLTEHLTEQQTAPPYLYKKKKERRRKNIYTPKSPKGTVKKEEETDERRYDGITYLG